MSRNTSNDDCQACDEYRELSRREFISRTTATAVALSVPAWLPRVTYAQTASDRDVLISIFLRGGADGLTLVPPFGESALLHAAADDRHPAPDSAANPALNLDGFFGLPPAMAAAAAGVSVGTAAHRPRHRLDRSVAVALRRAVLHGNRQAGRQERGHRVARPAPREPAADEGRRGAARHRLHLRPAADARRRAGHPADSGSGELRPLRQLVDAHAAARLARQRLPDRARSAAGRPRSTRSGRSTR